MKPKQKVVNQEGTVGVVIDHGGYSDYPQQIKTKSHVYVINRDGTSPYNNFKWRPLKRARGVKS